MCCFSGAVARVSDTSIFARSRPSGRQTLVYEMSFSSKDDVAMILPVPTPAGAADDAVRFFDLEGYPEFFSDLKSGFPTVALRASKGEPKPEVPVAAPPLPMLVSSASSVSPGPSSSRMS